MKRDKTNFMRVILFGFLFLLLGVASAQITHVYPAKDTDNAWTGRNDFSQAAQMAPLKTVTLGSLPTSCRASKDVVAATA